MARTSTHLIKTRNIRLVACILDKPGRVTQHALGATYGACFELQPGFMLYDLQPL